MVLYITQHGVPFDYALELDEAELMAFAVMIGENQGQEWCWKNLRWKEKN